MSYQIKLDPKSRKAARFISSLQTKIQKALIASGLTQQEVAKILDLDRSVVNRRLKGGANLTARSISDFAYAFDKDIVFEFVDRAPAKGANTAQASSSVVELRNKKAPTTDGTLKPGKKFTIERVAS